MANHPLKNKRIIFLGSSVVEGAASLGEPFVDFLSKKAGSITYKEAVSGTILVKDPNLLVEGSYVDRIQTISTDFKPDLFVWQLSTNDASFNKSLGTIDSTDTQSIIGTLNYIINYTNETWNCPLVFLRERILNLNLTKK